MTEQHRKDTAGAGSPAPAVPLSGTDAARPATGDVVPPEARVELDRIRRRWAELPLDRAESRMPVLRALLADLAPHGVTVPDLGPAVVADQLSVLVWDACAAGRGHGIPQLLADARRELG